MDLQEWELLSDDGLLDFHDDDDKKKVSSMANRSNSSTTGFDTSHFRCPPQLIPMPTQLNPSIAMPLEDEANNRAPSLQYLPTEADRDAVSKVLFNNLKGNEFVDIKLDSPKSSTGGILPPFDAESFQFDDKSESIENTNSPIISTDEDCKIKDEATDWKENNRDSTVWKWSLTGIGAICSLGVAAATVCISVLGSQQRSKQQQQNQKLRFQIYADEKRISQVARHKNAISAARGVPARAHITVGGYFNSH